LVNTPSKDAAGRLAFVRHTECGAWVESFNDCSTKEILPGTPSALDRKARANRYNARTCLIKFVTRQKAGQKLQRSLTATSEG